MDRQDRQDHAHAWQDPPARLPSLKGVIGLSVDEARDIYPLHIIRIIRKGQSITMDYCPIRVNLYVDNDGKILNATFG